MPNKIVNNLCQGFLAGCLNEELVALLEPLTAPEEA